ncbi:hypothetical protein [Pseudomonas syringae]|uniref:hypothetical protein n=1 Tax=Pseudomonas syringae TaxID=317 RepID=UPI002155FA59|nr:hypothetical protein [Pseudomonas syringae]
MSWTVYKEPQKPALCGLCYSWLLVPDEIVTCVPHVIGEKVLAQQMAQANKELKAGIEVRMLATPTDASKGLGVRRPERFRRCGSTGTPLTAFLTTPGKRCIYFHTQFETPYPPKSEPLRQYNRTYCRTPKNGLRL